MTFQQHAPYAAPVLALAWILVRYRRRVVRPGRLWILPALVLLGAGGLIASERSPSPALVAAMLVAAGVGAGLGRWRVGLRRLEVDGAGRIISNPSPAVLVLMLSLLALRSAARAGAGTALPVDPATLSDVLLAFAVGLICADRLHLYRRCRALVPLHAA